MAGSGLGRLAVTRTPSSPSAVRSCEPAPKSVFLQQVSDDVEIGGCRRGFPARRAASSSPTFVKKRLQVLARERLIEALISERRPLAPPRSPR